MKRLATVDAEAGSAGRRNLLRMGLIYAGAIVFGQLASLLNVPLPWMIGPLVFSAAVSMAGFAVRIPVATRMTGQAVVAATVGLYFTPTAFAALSEQLFAMLAVALLTIVAGLIAACILMRLGQADLVSASLASIPGGPVEMASIAERRGVPPGPVALAQTLRIALLVLIFPPVLVALDGGTIDARTAFGGSVDYGGAAFLLVIAAATGITCRWLRITNPFFLGPLGVSALASVLLLPVSMPPYWLLASAQVLLGVSLGCMFDRALFRRTRAILMAVFVSTLVLLLLCVGMAFLVGFASGIESRTMLLATAPGSVTEMALTAKILQYDVAMITAFHLVRIFVIVPAAPLMFAFIARLVRYLP